MNRISTYLVEKAKAYVMNLFDMHLPEECVFHSKEHTLDVFNNSQLIGNGIGLSENDLNCLGISAIFHDAGYINLYDNHESVSVEIAREFLSAENVKNDIIDQVIRAIMATKVPQKPSDLISRILCDADLLHLAGDNYFELMDLLRLEWKLTGRSDLTEKEFHIGSVDFFKHHEFHSTYGKKVLTPRKAHILELIINRISNL